MFGMGTTSLTPMAFRGNELALYPRHDLDSPTLQRHPLATADPCPLGYGLFIVVNAILLVRPMEIVSSVEGWPIYEYAILLCLVCSLPAILQRFQPATWAEQPISLCVFGLLPAVALSHLMHGQLGLAYEQSREFSKVIVYYVLLVSLLTSFWRLRTFCFWLVIFIVILAAVAIVNYHGWVEIASITQHQEITVNPETGEKVVDVRMCSTGIYGDPNDLCLILAVGMGLSAYWLTDSSNGPTRIVWLAPIVLFGYALAMTQSRGGFLATMAGMAVLFQTRYGWKKTIFLAAVAAPVVLLAFAGRQTSIDLSNPSDTARTRMELWKEGLELFKQSPLFGIGSGEYEGEVRHVAHNSCIHCFAELGFFGGTLFTSMLFLSAWPLFRLHRYLGSQADPAAARMRPFLLAVVVAYSVGIMSLSRSYVAPTYMVWGLASSYMALPELGEVPATRMSPKLIAVLIAVSVVFLVVVYCGLKVLAR